MNKSVPAKKFTLVSKKNPRVETSDVKVCDKKYYVTSCGLVCGEDNEPVSLEKANELKALYIKRGYKEMNIVEAGDYKPTRAMDNTMLENVTFSRIYIPKKDDRNNIDYVNMVKFSKSEIGVKLSLGSPTSIQSRLFGEIGNVKSFLDYLSNPKYPAGYLKRKKISNEVLATIPKCKGRILPNYWAIVTTVMIERFKQDRALVEELLTLPKSVKFTMFKVKTTTDVAGKEVTIVTPVSEYLRYCIIIQDIFNALKNNSKALLNTKTVLEIIQKNTMDTSKDIYHGLETIKSN